MGGYITLVVDMGNVYKFWWEILKGRDNSEDQG